MATKRRRVATEPDPSNPIILAIHWILENRTQPNGKRWSQRSLGMTAGLHASHLGQILKGYQGTEKLAVETVRKLAEAGNVRIEWMITGRGPREPYALGTVDELAARVQDLQEIAKTLRLAAPPPSDEFSRVPKKSDRPEPARRRGAR